MPKGYWIAHVEVHDPEGYQPYVDGARQAFIDHNARFLARGGPYEVLEGEQTGMRHVIIEFDSIETARACWNSQTYQAAREHRLKASTGSVMIMEGAD